jgi:hypothetical protein
MADVLDVQQSGIGRERGDYVLHHYTEVRLDCWLPALQCKQISALQNRSRTSNAVRATLGLPSQVKACYVKLRDSPWL